MMKRKEGFTLIELLVVIAIIGLLASILVPAVSSALTSAAMMQTVSNGANIYKSAFAGQMDLVSGGGASYSSWPSTDDENPFTSSTDYFISLVTNGVMDVSFDFFAARDIEGARSSDPSKFQEKNNAWKLVMNLDGCRDGTPFIFTRNYSISTVPTGEGPIQESELTGNNSKPFGTVGLVVVQKGGASKKLVKTQRRTEEFNAAGDPPGDITLSILDP